MMASRNAHIDIESQQQADTLRKDQTKKNSPQPGNPALLGKIHISNEATPWEKLGPAQVESLLAFVVDASTERDMEHAQIEAEVEDRVIRRKHGILD